MTGDEAETIAIQALGWLASDRELFGVFLSATGLDAAAVNARAADAEFLGGVLDFLLAVDAHVAAFAAEADIDPGVPRAARAALPGAAPDWG